MLIAGKTDKGLKRQNNQDSFAVGRFDDISGWAVVCDGMGGANAGNMASSEAVKIVSDTIVNNFRLNMSQNSIKHLIDSAISVANVSVFDLSRSNTDLNGMGTTIVVAIVVDDLLYIVHAGDSRAYLIDDDNITQLTRDHSIVQSMIEDGKITKSEARYHPSRNVITRALGVDENLETDFTVQTFNKNSALLLCTDGLTNFVDNDTILNIINNNENVDFAIDLLVDEANKNGGGDNITVVVIKNN